MAAGASWPMKAEGGKIAGYSVWCLWKKRKRCNQVFGLDMSLISETTQAAQVTPLI